MLLAKSESAPAAFSWSALAGALRLVGATLAIGALAACSGGEVVVLGSANPSSELTSDPPSFEVSATPGATASLAPDAPSEPGTEPSQDDEGKPDSYYMNAILQYCDERTPGLCFSECEVAKDNPGLNTVTLMMADVNIDMMVMYGNITRSEAAEFRPYWVDFWETYCP